MADGSRRPIEDLHAGDAVLSADPATGAIGIARVGALQVHAADVSSAGIVVLDGMLRVTKNHPIWVNGQVVPVGRVRQGDAIYVAGPSRAVRRSVASITFEPGGVVTYDLVLQGGRTFFAENVMMQIKP
jgi:hypothetical protein